jgi:hypothetical protein
MSPPARTSEQSELRKKLKAGKAFLVSLFTAKTKYRKKHVILAATDEHLHLLVNILAKICSKEVPISAAAFQATVKSKRMPLLHRHFMEADSANKLLSAGRRKQQAVLLQISTWSKLLHSLFHK